MTAVMLVQPDYLTTDIGGVLHPSALSGYPCYTLLCHRRERGELLKQRRDEGGLVAVCFADPVTKQARLSCHPMRQRL